MSLSGTSVLQSSRTESPRTHRGLTSALPWLSLLLLVLLTNSLLGVASGPTAVTIALLGVVHSAIGFYLHGGSRITAAGVLLFGMLIFGYFPTLYYAWLQQDFTPVPYEIRGLSALLAGQFVLYAVWSVPDRRVTQIIRHPVPPSAWVPGISLGLASLLVGVAIGALEISSLRSLAQPAGYGGIVLIAVSLVQARRRINLIALTVIASLFVTFVALLFTGGGRLVLGSLALALTMAIGFTWRPSYVKAATLAALPPGLALLAQIRADSVANPVTGYQESGLESVVWPQRFLFTLMEDSVAGYYAPGNGETFIASALIWVPREMWADKPVGFGLTLTQLYKPELLVVGHSEAALVQGEFVYNFGLWGLLLAAIVVGFAIFWLDAWLVTLHNLHVTSTSILIAQSVGTVLTAGVVDLVWVGTFTFVSRAGFTCAVLGLLWVIAKTLLLDDSPSRRRRPREARRPTRLAHLSGDSLVKHKAGNLP